MRVEAELASSHANAVAGGAAAGTAVTVVTGLIGAVRGRGRAGDRRAPAGAMVGAGSVRWAGARWQRRHDDVAEVIAHLLDRL